MRAAIVLLFTLATGACGTAWPEAVGGGMAEITHPAPVATAAPGVTRHLDCSLQNLAALAQAADRAGQATGRVAQLEIDANRARREDAGRLYADADRTLSRLDRDAALLAIVLGVSPQAYRRCTA